MYYPCLWWQEVTQVLGCNLVCQWNYHCILQEDIRPKASATSELKLSIGVFEPRWCACRSNKKLSVVTFTTHVSKCTAKQFNPPHFQHFSIFIWIEVVNNLDTVKTGHMQIPSTCTHLLDLFPVKYKILQTMNSLTWDLGTNIHIHLKAWQGKRLKMLTDRSGCDRLGTKVD